MTRPTERLKEKLTPEEFELASEILSLPVSKVREFIEKTLDEVMKA